MPVITLSSDVLARFEEATRKEWLVTNGLGGYASSTVLGLNTRKYHGLLVAALHPPGDRTVCLSKLDEDLLVGDTAYRFGVNRFGDSLFPTGHLFLKRFLISPFPTFTYSVDGFFMEKTVFMPHGKNVVVILYNLQNKRSVDAKVRVFPSATCRRFHSVVNHWTESLAPELRPDGKHVSLDFAQPKATVVAYSTSGKFVEVPNWVERVHYREETERGESDVDAWYQPGYYEVALDSNENLKFGVAVSADEASQKALTAIEQAGGTLAGLERLRDLEVERFSSLLNSFYVLRGRVPASDWLNWVLLAADSFVVRGEGRKRAVIAGYFWFESWGRDTFVSLPGLMLVTGRFRDARSVLLGFSGYCRRGLIPNLIADESGQPVYNTVDGTLWFVNAVFQYLKYTGDFGFVRKQLWGTLKSIVKYHEVGTYFGIKMDADGLLAHGSGLTWMDAFVEGRAVTPRLGKAVEVQALWYNALRIVESLAIKFGERQLAEKYRCMAERALDSFNLKFWNGAEGCLYDVVDGLVVDGSLRPNQIVAVSLDFTMLSEERDRLIVDVAEREFLTPRGLRTLSRGDPRYRKVYLGDKVARDLAYHNGTVWPWLFGPFVTAYFKVEGHSEGTVDFVLRNVVRPLFEEHLLEGGLGTVSEIFDAEPPFTPRGCIAQAWSVAEPLRAYVEDVLGVGPGFERLVLGLGV